MAPAVWLRQDGPLEARYPGDTCTASRDFCRRVPEDDDALLVAGRTWIKPRLYLYKLVNEVMELIAFDNTIKFDPLNWEQVERCQWWNGLIESRVKALKVTLKYTLSGEKPTLSQGN